MIFQDKEPEWFHSLGNEGNNTLIEPELYFISSSEM